MEEDGLSKSWKNEVVFVNPHYGNIGKWVKKAYEESKINGASVVMLIPSRTDTKYWHDYIEGNAEYHAIKGRIRFLHNGSPSEHVSRNSYMCVIFRKS